MPKKLTQEEFISKATAVHGDKYKYILVNYTNSYGMVDIICNTHGLFSINANALLQGTGCKKCYFEGNRLKQQEFIDKCELKHPNKYDYTVTKYKNRRTNIKVKCLKHDLIFNTNYNSILYYNDACPECQKEEKVGININTKEHFIERARSVHGDNYDYEKSEYLGLKHKVEILCKKCNSYFTQSPSVHISDRCGCPKCKNSKGELNTSKILEEAGFEYIQQHRFPDCKHINLLKFDFYLPYQNLCIEFDGIQHFEPIKAFGGEEKFKLTQKRDKIKEQYCKDNGIDLIRIRYDEDIIQKIEDFFTPKGPTY
jgi:very-short-patch-repair endonuclease